MHKTFLLWNNDDGAFSDLLLDAREKWMSYFRTNLTEVACERLDRKTLQPLKISLVLNFAEIGSILLLDFQNFG